MTNNAPAMRQRPFGKTGLTTPELMLGGGFVGGIMIHSDEDTRRTALNKVLDAGSDWIDTATSYGNGQSETNIGRLLQEMPKERRPRVSSKIGLTPEDLKDPKSAVRKALEASLERLQMDKLELYQLHNRIGWSGSQGRDWFTPYDILRPGGIADAFEAAREDGLTDFTGITALGNTAAVRGVIASERFQSAQVYYNMLNPTAAVNAPPGFDTTDFRGLLGACRTHGLGVIGIRILAAGVLATNERHGREIPITDNSDPATEDMRADAVWRLLGERNEPHAATAIRYGLANQDFSTIEFGAAEMSHIDIALAAQAAGPLEADALAKLATAFQTA
jgi:D-threo-aldose 1-dehydrogenase